MRCRKIINTLFLAAGIIFVLYYVIAGLAVRFGQSMLWVWPFTGICLIIRWALVRHCTDKGVPLPFPGWMIRLVRAGCAAMLTVFAVTQICVLSGFSDTCPSGVDYLLLLGAKTGSVTIERRIDTAAEYLRDNPDTLVICAGGQGPDEEVPEGRYMADGLIARGIDPARIIIEDKSTTTSENIAFSRLLVDDANVSVAVVSNNYHVFRAKALARKYFPGEVYAIPMASNRFSLPHYMVREFFTIVVDGLRGNLAF